MGRRGRVKAAAGFPEAGTPQCRHHPSFALCPSFQGLSPWKPRNLPQLPINCLCPHLLGDASGRLRRRENLFPDPIQRRGLPVRDLHSHRRHRLQGEVAAGFASQQQAGVRHRATALSLPILALQDSCGSLPRGHQGCSPGTRAVARLEESGHPPTGYEK